jgi:3-deoxy-D-manno-octulosonic-acid transferase
MRKDPVEWILRGLYSVVLYILLPITVYHLVWRGFRVREYFRRWDERYASYPQPTGQPRVWLHAVSVGEVNAAAPLVNALRKERPDIRWVITTITPTGSERVRCGATPWTTSTCRTTCPAASTASSATSSPAWR